MTVTIFDEIKETLSIMNYYMEFNVTPEIEGAEIKLSSLHLSLQEYLYREVDNEYAESMFTDWIVDGFCKYVGLFLYVWLNSVFNRTQDFGIKYHFQTQTTLLLKVLADPNKADELIKELSYSLVKIRELAIELLEKKEEQVH